MTRKLCAELVDGFVMSGSADAAGDYAQQIPVRVIAAILGVPSSLSATFTGWVRDVLEFADDPELRRRGVEGLIGFFVEEVARRKREPGDDLLSDLLHSDFEGAPVEESVVLGVAALVLIAGVDTTWSAIGSSLWHLAAHPEDRRRMVAEPDAHAPGRRGAPAGLLAGDHGQGGHRGRRVPGLPDEGRRQGADELPGRQP